MVKNCLKQEGKRCPDDSRRRDNHLLCATRLLPHFHEDFSGGMVDGQNKNHPSVTLRVGKSPQGVASQSRQGLAYSGFNNEGWIPLELRVHWPACSWVEALVWLFCFGTD